MKILQKTKKLKNFVWGVKSYLLHEVAHAEHGRHQLRSVFAPTFLDLRALARVQHKVTFYDACLSQHVDVELLFEYFLEERHPLGGHEPLKVVLGL